MPSYFDMSPEEYMESYQKMRVPAKHQSGDRDLISVIIDLDYAEFSMVMGSVKPVYKSMLNFGPLSPALRLREDGVVVVYTESEEKLERGVRTVGKLGKFLRRIAVDDAPDYKIESMVNAIRAKFVATMDTSVVKFAVTADDIRRVYVGGPSSCMDAKAWNDSDNYHPCMSYAYPPDRTEIVPDSGNSIAVAYMGDIDRASARAVVNVEAKQYRTIYGGMRSTLGSVLKELGYTDNCCFLDRQKLAFKRARSGGIYLPYLDGCNDNVVIEDDEFLVIGEDGDHQCNSSGIIGGPERSWCDIGQHWVDEDDRMYMEHEDRTVCSDCCDEHYTYAIVSIAHINGCTYRSREYVFNDDAIEVDGEYYYEPNAFECGLYQCANCENWYGEDDISCIESDDNYDRYKDVIDDTDWCAEDSLCPTCYAEAIAELDKELGELEEASCLL